MKWRKTCTGLNFDLEHFNGPQTKFIGNSLYKHPVHKHLQSYKLMQIDRNSDRITFTTDNLQVVIQTETHREPGSKK